MKAQNIHVVVGHEAAYDMILVNGVPRNRGVDQETN